MILPNKCENNLPKFAKNIKVMKHILADINCQFVYVLQPVITACREKAQDPLLQVQQLLSQLAEQEQFLYLNHLDLFDGREQYFVDPCHLGDLGNTIIAEQLLQELSAAIAERVQRIQ